MRTGAGAVSMVHHAAARPRVCCWPSRCLNAAFFISLAAVLLLGAAPALAQDAPPPPSSSLGLSDSGQPDVAVPAATPAAAPHAPPPGGKSGLIGVIQRWIDDAATSPPRDPLKDARQALDNLGETAKKAGDSAIRATQESAGKLSGLPGAGTVTGREKCTVAPNGAPDCADAAARLCRAKGFSTGASADFVSSENCPAQVWLSGGRDKSSCTTETHVTRALCQ